MEIRCFCLTREGSHFGCCLRLFRSAINTPLTDINRPAPEKWLWCDNLACRSEAAADTNQMVRAWDKVTLPPSLSRLCVPLPLALAAGHPLGKLSQSLNSVPQTVLVRPETWEKAVEDVSGPSGFAKIPALFPLVIIPLSGLLEYSLSKCVSQTNIYQDLSICLPVTDARVEK